MEFNIAGKEKASEKPKTAHKSPLMWAQYFQKENTLVIVLKTMFMFTAVKKPFSIHTLVINIVKELE